MVNEHIYGYASMRTGQMKNDLIQNFSKTKLYSEYLNIVSFLQNCMFYVPDEEQVPDSSLVTDNMIFDPDRVLQVDVMTSKREGMHYKLDCIIQQAKEETEKRIAPPYNTIITINSIGVFGDCESIKKYYRIFRKEKIGVLFPDYTRNSSLSEYSTIGYDFSPRPLNEYNRAFDLVERLDEKDLPDNRGRIGGEYTRAFRVAFWLYELFRVSEDIAVAMSGYSKRGFHMKATSYEQTLNYKMELEIFDQNFSISKIVKRNRSVPDNFDKLIRRYEKRGDLELACILCKIPMIFPVDYDRLLLKYRGGRKEIVRCMKLYDQELMEQFDKWVKEGKKATEFYRECGMEQYLYQTRTIS
ncbi:MAG: hypothetical protein NC548_32950 [Lachnospiraceae bacterium]|nr:hypothetical protein [Lachnospiraceae bacterium]